MALFVHVYSTASFSFLVVGQIKITDMNKPVYYTRRIISWLKRGKIKSENLPDNSDNDGTANINSFWTGFDNRLFYVVFIAIIICIILLAIVLTFLHDNMHISNNMVELNELISR